MRIVNNSDPSPTYDWRLSPNLPEFISLMRLCSSVYLNCKESYSAIVGGSYDNFSFYLSPIIYCIDVLNRISWIIIFCHHNALEFSPETLGKQFPVGVKITDVNSGSKFR